jgi:hypothetical protein
VCRELLPSVAPIRLSFLLGEKKAFGLQKVVFHGLFQKFLGISVPPIFFLMVSVPRVKKG